MRYILGHDKLHNEMLLIIKNAEKYVYLTAFEFDLYYNNKELYNILVNNIKTNNIKLYLVTSGLCITSVNYEPTKKLKEDYPHNCFIKIQHTTENDICVLPYFYNKKISGVHYRYIANEKCFLLCGGNYSEKFSGSIYDNERYGLYNYAWLDGGLLLNSIDKKVLDNLYNDDYSTVKYPFVIDTHKQYHYLIYRILTAKKSIYFETQYFFSHNEISQNKIHHALTERIINAIVSKEDFCFTMIVNTESRDENRLRYSIMSQTICYCIMGMINDIIKKTNIEYNKLRKYVRIYTPTKKSKLCIHTKTYIFDDRNMLFTSANIYDASFYSKGQKELGYISENNPDICEIIKSSIPKTLLKKNKLEKIMNSRVYLVKIFNRILIKTITMMCAPIHTCFEDSNIIDMSKYPCDNIKYSNLTKKPAFLRHI